MAKLRTMEEKTMLNKFRAYLSTASKEDLEADYYDLFEILIDDEI